MQLAAIRKKNWQQEHAIKILDAIWQNRTQDGSILFDAVKPGLELAAVYEENGREDAIAIRSAISLRYFNSIPCLPTTTILTPTTVISLEKTNVKQS
jgi:hypothetical protein